MTRDAGDIEGRRVKNTLGPLPKTISCKIAETSDAFS